MNAITRKRQRTGTGKYEQLLETCRKLHPVSAAVAHPCEESALDAAALCKHADSAGVVLGARVPVVLTSRADSVRARMASVAVAVRMVYAQRTQTGGVA